MKDLILQRREFIRLTLISSLLSLTGCAPYKTNFLIRGDKFSLPEELYAILPEDWDFQSFKSPIKIIEKEDLLILQDGWLNKVSPKELIDLDLEQLNYNINDKAISFINNLPGGYDKKVFPFFFSPWVILFRNENSIITDKSVSWDILLRDDLKGKVIFPESPYLLISIAKKMGFLNYLTKLKQQAKAFDDKNALNWILSGRAKAAVLPLNRCYPSLFQDPRLSAFLPNFGAPLNWIVIVRPKGSSNSIPLGWISKSWSKPTLAKIIPRGFFPSYNYSYLDNIIPKVSGNFNLDPLLNQKYWNNCWSLPLLSDESKEEFTKIWNNA